MSWWSFEAARPELVDAGERRTRNCIVLKAILAAPVEREDRAWYLTHALRRHSELVATGRWQRAAFRTAGAIASAEAPVYEHVVDNRWFKQILMGEPERWLEEAGALERLLALQVTCLVTKEEHRRLGVGFGWERYLRPKVAQCLRVLDCRVAPFLPVDLEKLVSAQHDALDDLGLAARR